MTAEFLSKWQAAGFGQRLTPLEGQVWEAYKCPSVSRGVWHLRSRAVQRVQVELTDLELDRVLKHCRLDTSKEGVALYLKLREAADHVETVRAGVPA